MTGVPGPVVRPTLLEGAVMNAIASISTGRAALLVAFLLALPAAAGAAPRPKPAPKQPPAAAPKPSAPSLQPPALPIAKLVLEPATATLTGPRAEQHFLVTATLQDGSTVDVTDRAAFQVAAPKVARIS